MTIIKRIGICVGINILLIFVSMFLRTTLFGEIIYELGALYLIPFIIGLLIARYTEDSFKSKVIFALLSSMSILLFNLMSVAISFLLIFIAPKEIFSFISSLLYFIIPYIISIIIGVFCGNYVRGKEYKQLNYKIIIICLIFAILSMVITISLIFLLKIHSFTGSIFIFFFFIPLIFFSGVFGFFLPIFNLKIKKKNEKMAVWFKYISIGIYLLIIGIVLFLLYKYTKTI